MPHDKRNRDGVDLEGKISKFPPFLKIRKMSPSEIPASIGPIFPASSCSSGAGGGEAGSRNAALRALEGWIWRDRY